MALNGILDAAVNGGTQKYIEAFLSELEPYAHAITWHALIGVDVYTLCSQHAEICGHVTRHERIVEMERRGNWLRHAKGWSLRCGDHEKNQQSRDHFDSKESTRVVPPPSHERALATDLKDLLREQLIYCGRGLKIFIDRAPENLLPLSEHLTSMLEMTRKKINPII